MLGKNDHISDELAEAFDSYASFDVTRGQKEESWRVIDHVINKQIRTRRTQIISVAASVLLIFAISVMYSMKNQSNGSTEMAENENKSIKLSDKSKVYLAKGSSLQYPEQFEGERRVFLDGKAFFDVQRDESMPFIVEADHVNIRVLGTSFSVNNEYNGKVVVAVQEGTVRVEDTDNAENTMLLEAGEKVVYTDATASFSSQTIRKSNEWSWKTGQLIFNDIALSEAFKDMQRYYNIEIEVADKAMLDCHYTSTLAVKETSAKEVLEMIALVHDFELVEHSDSRFKLVGGSCK